jgi:hypothetical protein
MLTVLLLWRVGCFMLYGPGTLTCVRVTFIALVCGLHLPHVWISQDYWCGNKIHAKVHLAGVMHCMCVCVCVSERER